MGRVGEATPTLQDIRRIALSVGGAAMLGIGVHAANAAPLSDARLPTALAATEAATHPSLTFDDLGGVYPEILVYPSVATRRIGKWPEHYSFWDDDKVSALCKKLGRLVQSDPSVGQRKRSSRWWVRIDGIPTGVTEYASAVYMEHPKTLLRELPACVEAKKSLT